MFLSLRARRTVMGASLSRELLLEELVDTLKSMKQRLGAVESEVAGLRKSVINANVAHNEHSRLINQMQRHIFHSTLLEEGRSKSVRPVRRQSQSLVLK